MRATLALNALSTLTFYFETIIFQRIKELGYAKKNRVQFNINSLYIKDFSANFIFHFLKTPSRPRITINTVAVLSFPQGLAIKVSEYPQKLKILKATFSWFTVFLFD